MGVFGRTEEGKGGREGGETQGIMIEKRLPLPSWVLDGVYLNTHFSSPLDCNR